MKQTTSKTQEFINASTTDLVKRAAMKRRFNWFLNYIKITENIVRSQEGFEDYRATWSTLNEYIIDEWVDFEWKKANRHKDREHEVHETLLMLAAFYEYLKRTVKPIENPAAQSLLHLENGLMKRRQYRKKVA